MIFDVFVDDGRQFWMFCMCLCDDDCRIFVCFRVIIVMILDVLCDDYHDF